MFDIEKDTGLCLYSLITNKILFDINISSSHTINLLQNSFLDNFVVSTIKKWKVFATVKAKLNARYHSI